MTNDSLIEKLAAAAHTEVFHGSGSQRSIAFDKAIAIVRAHESDKFSGQVAKQFRNDRMCINGQWWVPAKDYAEANPDQEHSSLGSSVTDGTYSREYEEQPKSTPVSLEKCVKAAQAAHWNKGQLSTIDMVAKAVLEAAQVPYVD